MRHAILFPSSLIGTFFFIHFVVTYPREFKESLLFQDGPWYGVGNWLILASFVYFVVTVVAVLT